MECDGLGKYPSKPCVLKELVLACGILGDGGILEQVSGGWMHVLAGECGSWSVFSLLSGHHELSNLFHLAFAAMIYCLTTGPRPIQPIAYGLKLLKYEPNYTLSLKADLCQVFVTIMER